LPRLRHQSHEAEEILRERSTLFSDPENKDFGTEPPKKVRMNLSSYVESPTLRTFKTN